MYGLIRSHVPATSQQEGDHEQAGGGGGPDRQHELTQHLEGPPFQRACYAEDGSIPAVVHTRTKEVDGSTKSVMMLEKIHKDQDKSRHKHQHLSAALNRVEEKNNKAARKGG